MINDVITIKRWQWEICSRDMAAAQLLSQLLYFSQHAKARAQGKRWVAFSRRQWCEVAMLTDFQFKRAMTKLEGNGLVEKIISGFGGRKSTLLRATEVTLLYAQKVDLATNAVVKPCIDANEQSDPIYAENPQSGGNRHNGAAAGSPQNGGMRQIGEAAGRSQGKSAGGDHNGGNRQNGEHGQATSSQKGDITPVQSLVDRKVAENTICQSGGNRQNGENQGVKMAETATCHNGGNRQNEGAEQGSAGRLKVAETAKMGKPPDACGGNRHFPPDKVAETAISNTKNKEFIKDRRKDIPSPSTLAEAGAGRALQGAAGASGGSERVAGGKVADLAEAGGGAGHVVRADGRMRVEVEGDDIDDGLTVSQREQIRAHGYVLEVVDKREWFQVPPGHTPPPAPLSEQEIIASSLPQSRKEVLLHDLYGKPLPLTEAVTGA